VSRTERTNRIHWLGRSVSKRGGKAHKIQAMPSEREKGKFLAQGTRENYTRVWQSGASGGENSCRSPKSATHIENK